MHSPQEQEEGGKAALAIARLEQQTLDEYAQVANNLDDVTAVVQRLASAQPHLLQELRPLERKLGLVLTLFKASVWSLLRQREDQQMYEEELRQ
ncbi:hypothetical protein JCM8097_007712 [Rhodosporidiobolus ruineniae]